MNNTLVSIIVTIIVLLGGVWLITHEYVTQKELNQTRTEIKDSIKDISDEIKTLENFERNWERTEKEQLYHCR